MHASAIEADMGDSLVARAAHGDEAAFARIVAAHHDDMARVSFVVCRDAQLAQEAATAAWSIAWRRLSTVRDPSKLRSWLLAIAANEARGLVRRRGRRALKEIAVDRLPEHATATVTGDPAAGIALIDLSNALARLDPTDRTVVGLSAAGLSSTEIGQAIGMSPVASGLGLGGCSHDSGRTWAMADHVQEKGEAMTDAQLLARVWDWAGQADQPIDAAAIARAARGGVRFSSFAPGAFEWGVPARSIRWATFGLIVIVVVMASLAAGGLLVGVQHRVIPAIVEPNLPPAFGPARNGMIVISVGSGGSGSLVAVDPISGATRELGPHGYLVGPDFSNDGRRLMFGAVTGEGTVSISIINADGSGIRVLGPELDYVDSAWAPDGVRVAAVRRQPGQRLSIRDVETGAVVELDLGIDIGGIRWRPNHDQILISGPDAHPGTFLVNADGTGLRKVEAGSGIWSPDGSMMAYGSADGRVHILSMDSGTDTPLTFEGSDGTRESPVAFSPDGTRLLITRSLLGEDIAPSSFPRMYCCREPWLHVVVPVAGGGPAVTLGFEKHRSLGGPGGDAMFSPDGTEVLGIYTQRPVGTWLFDATTGLGERQAWGTGGDWQGMTWQRLGGDDGCDQPLDSCPWYPLR